MKTKNFFYLHISEDMEGLKNVPITGLSFATKKDAKKAMMDLASKDLTQGRYYFYRLIEQKMITHEIYPSTETTK